MMFDYSKIKIFFVEVLPFFYKVSRKRKENHNFAKHFKKSVVLK